MARAATTAGREIVISRDISAPRELVFEALGGQQTLSNLAAYVTEIVRKGVEGW
jgi:hypothetical protein